MNAFERLSKFSQSGHITDCTAWIFPYKRGYSDGSPLNPRDAILVNCRVNQDESVRILEVLQTSPDIEKYNDFRENFRDYPQMGLLIIGEDRLPKAPFRLKDIKERTNGYITRTFRFDQAEQYMQYGLLSPHIAFLD